MEEQNAHRKPMRKRPSKKSGAPAFASSNGKKIKESLTKIYRDPDGKIPDMKTITIKRDRHWSRVFALTIVAIFAAFGVWALWLAPGNKFSEDRITLALAGATDLTVGKPVSVTVAYANKEKAALQKVVLHLNYPKGFLFAESSPSAKNTGTNGGNNEWPLGDLSPGEAGSITVTGHLFGLKDSEQSWRANLAYQPANFNSELQKTALLTTRLVSSPVSLAVAGPAEAAAGNKAEFRFTVEQQATDWVTSTLELAPAFPAQFKIATATPKMSKNNRWLIPVGPTTSTPQKWVFTAQGAFVESADESAKLNAALSVSLPRVGNVETVAAAEHTTKLAKSGLAFNVAINGSLDDFESKPGDILNATVHLKNTNPQPLKKVSVKLVFAAPSLQKQSVLKWPEVSDKYDGDIQGEQISKTMRRGTIAWTSQQLPLLASLKPNEELDIDVRLPIRESADIDWGEVAAHEVTVSAEVTYKNAAGTVQTIAANPIKITLNSDLKLEVRDTVRVTPDEFNLEHHSIVWVLTNSYHPIKNLSLTATLFGDITWQNDAAPAAGTVNYDATQKQVTWTITEMPTSADVLTLPFTVTLNSKNPSQNTLVSKVRVLAEDAVTGKKIEMMGNEILLNQ